MTNQSGKRFCGVCLFELEEKVVFRPGKDCTESDLKPHFQKIPRQGAFDQSGLESSAARGCTVCTAVMEEISRWGVDTGYSLHEADWEWGTILTLSGPIEICCEYKPDSEHPQAYKFHPYVRVRGIPSKNTGSAAAFHTMRSWISRCSEQHSVCGTWEASKLPDRIVSIGTTEAPHIRVIDETLSIGPAMYACLSHRWGPTTLDSSLTRDRLSEFEKAVSEEFIYPVLREAIETTRQLGLRYIWIDSLCILQDDPRDWALQASKMADFYTNACITLSALWCSGFDNDQLFSDNSSGKTPKKLRDIGEWSIFLWNDDPSSHPIHCNEEQNQYGAIWSYSFPLFLRGWCFQERLLSKRIIYFTQEELVWECLKDSWCECRPLGMREELAFIKKDSSDLHKTFYLSPSSLKNILTQPWADIVDAYGGTQLSFERDRLPAISAIAKIVGETNGWTYLAGVWLENLDTELFWDHGFPWPGRYRVPPEPEISAEASRLPSWSWASSPESVSFQSPRDTCDKVFTLCDHEIKFPEDAIDKFGAPELAVLVIKAPLIKVKILHESQSWDYRLAIVDKNGVESVLADQTVGSGLDRSFSQDDTTKCYDDNEDCFLLLCYSTFIQEHQALDWQGLVLKRVSTKPNIYGRIGIFADRTTNTVVNGKPFAYEEYIHRVTLV